MGKILVWDLPTRLGHWLLVAAFVVSWVTGDSEEWRLIHVAAGYAMAGVLAFRVFWGMAGTRYARFSSFLFSPRQVVAYFTGLFKGKSAHWVGHNPAGSYAIYMLLLLGVATIASGWATYNEIGGEWLEDAHDVLSYAMLGVIFLHVAGVIFSSLIHRENLVRSMLDGHKQGEPAEAIPSGKCAWVITLMGVAALAGWLAFAGQA